MFITQLKIPSACGGASENRPVTKPVICSNVAWTKLKLPNLAPPINNKFSSDFCKN